jgi:hypothetical protein
VYRGFLNLILVQGYKCANVDLLHFVYICGGLDKSLNY